MTREQEAILLQIIGHLGAAIVQSIPSDDQIIMGHVGDAHKLAKNMLATRFQKGGEQ